MEKRERLEFEGVVVESNKGKFIVKVNDSYSPICTLSGKIRQNFVRILVGDKVKIEISEYSPDLGRIVYREKN
jgi:translation initiation factor IF-1